MDKEYIINNYEFRKLSEKDDLTDFNCESTDLNEFLKNDAINQQKECLNITKLVVCDDKIIGFFSLLTDTIDLKKVRDEKTKESIKEELPNSKELPAVKIGRFAINKKYANKGIGSHVLRNIIFNIILISELCGFEVYSS